MLTSEMTPAMVGKTLRITTETGDVVTDVLEAVRVDSDIERYGDGVIARVTIHIEAQFSRWAGRFDGNEGLEVLS